MNRRIKLCPFSECTGCEACYNACPTNAINMELLDGFYHPVINHNLCIKCNACTRSCPILTKPEYLPLTNSRGAYAAYSKDENTRTSSSSGGIFSELAKQIINQNGFVFGAAFSENWQVNHLQVSTSEKLSLLRGSKYVQSRIMKTYRVIRDILVHEQPVIFSGTPCQVAGLKEYLGKEYDHLVTVSVFCHGVPSPLAWSRYLSSMTCDKLDDIETIFFRYKENGKMPYRFVLKNHGCEPLIESPQANIYMRAFISGLGLRPSCYDCPYRHKLVADVLIGDFWGIEKVMPEVGAKSGVSAVFACSDKGKALISNVTSAYWMTSNYGAIVAQNPSLIKSPKRHYGTKRYIACLNSKPYILLTTKCLKPNLPRQINNMLKRLLGR